MGSQELEAGDTFNNHPVNVDGVMRASFLLPEVHNKLLCLAGVKEQVIVSAPCGQVLYLLPVGSLIVVFDEANHRGVICKLDDGVGSMYRPALHIPCTAWNITFISMIGTFRCCPRLFIYNTCRTSDG